jgi:hypothetical protein
MKEMKFKISSEEQSKRLQEVLSELGCRWQGKKEGVRNVISPYLYVNSEGNLTHSFLLTTFEDIQFEEVDTEEFIKKHTVTYMVSVEGKRAPKKEHFSKEEADKEAYRLAKLLPYRKVRVLKVENVYRSEIVITKE